jgi:pimeloyl-ACP methyl ester carboxylesterase
MDYQHVLTLFDREARLGVGSTPRDRLRFWEWGQGTAVVFVHGVSDISRSFVPVAARLRHRYRCVGYDLPLGQGDGARLWAYQHHHLVADLWVLLDHLGLERACVVGSSFGSTIALAALRQRPDRLVRGVLQGGLAHRPLKPVERFLAWLLQAVPGPTSWLPRRERMLEVVHRPAFEGLPEEVWQAFVDCTGQSRLKAMGHQLRLLHGVDLRAELPHIHQPVLLIHGQQDTVIPRSHADMLLAGLPHARLVELPNCGHVPSYTHPDLFAQAIDQFLSEA